MFSAPCASPGIIGLPSMLDGGPAWATVTTRTPVRALVASSSQFRSLCAGRDVALRMWAEAGARLRQDILAIAFRQAAPG